MTIRNPRDLCGSLIALWLLNGCAPSLSSFQSAHVAPRGHFSASVGLEAGIPVGAIGSLTRAAKGLAQRGQMGQPLSDAEKWQIFDAGVNLILASPTFGPHFAVAYTPLDRFEVAVRYAGSAWRAGTRYQILDHRTAAIDLTVGVGLSRYAYGSLLSNDIPGLSVDTFSRWQIDIPVLVGTTHDWFQVWTGPKLLLTRFSTQLALELPSSPKGRIGARFDGDASFIGGQAGVALGYRRLYVAFELTLAEGFGFARLTAPELSPSTRDSTLSSFTVFPAFGLLGEF